MAVRLLFVVQALFILAAAGYSGSGFEDYQTQIEELQDIILSIVDNFVDFSTSVRSDIAIFADSVRSDIATMKADIAGIKEDGEIAKENLATVKGTLQSLNGSIKSVKKGINSIVKDASGETEDVGDGIEGVAKVMNRVEDGMSDVKDEMEDIEDDIEDVEDDIEDVEDDVDDVKDDMKDVKECVEAMKEDTEIMKGAVEAIREDMGYVKEDMETLKNNLTAFWVELSRDNAPIRLPTEPSEPPHVTDEGFYCGGTSGWKQVALLNMTNATHNCPAGWSETSYSSKRTCGRASTCGRSCHSTVFPVNGLEYSRVCGRAVAYQFGSVSAFHSSSLNIESHYVNGLALTHGIRGNRSHIWTFAAGVSEGNTQYASDKCPCDGGTSPVPDFVGSDYFCESGLNGPWVIGDIVFYPNDKLWDGEDCLASSTCCNFNRPPYFIKEMGSVTTDDIEARICSVYQQIISDVVVEFLELYVQ